jgi:hypothetical protein
MTQEPASLSIQTNRVDQETRGGDRVNWRKAAFCSKYGDSHAYLAISPIISALTQKQRGLVMVSQERLFRRASDSHLNGQVSTPELSAILWKAIQFSSKGF